MNIPYLPSPKKDEIWQNEIIIIGDEIESPTQRTNVWTTTKMMRSELN